MTGPAADVVRVRRGAAAGRLVHRVRIPGRFPPRDARAVVSVGGRAIGVGVETPEGDALVAATFDASALVAGAPVTIRWGDAPAVDAGALEVLR
ncbi:MAG: hypothetical protein HYX34_06470 [Actinobacteria bacterium]|nr:hypothetical protein [Actinomycetota bacterium]